MKIWKNAVLFYIGGGIYLILELLWRGRSHGSMFLAGGLCFLLIGHLGRVEPRFGFPMRVLLGVLIVTMVELGFGLAVNREYAIWDYRGQPGNFLGMICPQFCLLWIPLSALAAFFYDRMEPALERKLSPG